MNLNVWLRVTSVKTIHGAQQAALPEDRTPGFAKSNLLITSLCIFSFQSKHQNGHVNSQTSLLPLPLLYCKGLPNSITDSLLLNVLKSSLILSRCLPSIRLLLFFFFLALPLKSKWSNISPLPMDILGFFVVGGVDEGFLVGDIVVGWGIVVVGDGGVDVGE